MAAMVSLSPPYADDTADGIFKGDGLQKGNDGLGHSALAGFIKNILTPDAV